MQTPPWLLSAVPALATLPDVPAGERFQYLLEHGSMKVGIYAPRGHDPQGPHVRDEIYVIISGTGTFVKNGERHPFQPHDLLFVEAGAEHRFEDFSDDFATWVLFWGPKGGEAA
ncbi:cupin domain-containing protein [Nitrospirillum viridazoti]|uniref:Cupin n=1 Tax=Nitrospirillum viridazoti CBAmc TaxID=1441467 RepID=A0A248JVD1_9PROT|nr:cupin domain-containing protein [Nitrospirillum amazonense]ASG22645.1 cupin [Nitrospirillum amazonense CBAmc]